MKKQFAIVIAFLLLLVSVQSFASTSMRVMTYNIRRDGKEKAQKHMWRNRVSLVQEVLKKTEPDIIGLQEATYGQLNDLKKLLPNFFSCGRGRGSSWWGLGANEYNPILYNKNKFMLLDYGTFEINKTNSVLGWMPWHVKQTGFLPRICTVAKFKVKKTNQEFYVYNTHFDHQYKQAQICCAKAVRDHVAKHTQGLPVIVMGDFNTDFVDEVKAIFANFHHMRDRAQRSSGPRVTRTGWDNKKQICIDHILINSASTSNILHYCVVEHEGKVFASDHQPVFADIELEMKKMR